MRAMIHRDTAVRSALANKTCLGQLRLFFLHASAFILLPLCSGFCAETQNALPSFVPFSGMTFSGLTGGYPTPYPGSTEGNFTLIPTAGSWFVSTTYGNTGPSIYDGPVNSPGYAVL